MKPIGTITSCFPYIDGETKSILQSVMEEAKDYNDFAERLVEKALSEELPELAIYFTYFHVYILDKYDFLHQLRNKGIKSDLTIFFGLLSAARAGEKVEWNEYQKALFSALKSVENDWMACHLYITWRIMIEAFGYPEVSTDNETMNILEDKILNDDRYGYFLVALYSIKSIQLDREGNTAECISYCDKAIKEAKKYDDKEALTSLLLRKANKIKHFNIHEALSILEIAKKLADELGYISAKGAYHHVLGHIAMARGEFEKSTAYQEQYLASREKTGLPVGFLKCVMASIYNQKGDGKTALELVLEGQDDFVLTEVVYSHVQETWAHILLDQLDEASESLDKARELSLKYGEETDVGFIHVLEGMLAKRNGDLASASYSFNQAFGIFKKSNSTAYINFTLVELVDTEIELISNKKDIPSLDNSGPWMRELQQHVAERDLPGTEAHAKLLLAKFRFKQGRVTESQSLADEVLDIAETTGMTYLKKKAEDLLPEVLLS